jgi:type I restriction enzyme, S subunit
MSEKTSSELPRLLPNGWRLERIDSLTRSNIRDFGSFSMTNLIEFVENGVPFIKSESVINGRINFGTIAFIAEAVHRQLTKSFVFEGDILFTKIGAIGRVAVYDGSLGICNSNAATAKIQINSSKANSKFVAYQLGSERVMREFARTIISTPPRINLGDINSMRIEFPSLPEQEKIVKILSTIDRTITHTEALIEKYQQIKAGLMHDLFTRGIGADGQLRPMREQAPELYWESAIGWIPKEWEVKTITSFADVIDPNPSHRNPIYHDEGFPFISTVEFEEFDQIRMETSRRVIEEIVLEQERRCKFSASSIVFSRKGTIGETRFLPSHLRFALLDSLCVINPTSISSSFLFHAVRSHFLKRQIKNMTMGQALPQMSIGRVRDLLVPTPIEDFEQKKIESKLSEIDEFILTNGQELKKLKQQKSGLMHDLLTGKVQVTIDDDAEVTHG